MPRAQHAPASPSALSFFSFETRRIEFSKATRADTGFPSAAQSAAARAGAGAGAAGGRAAMEQACSGVGAPGVLQSVIEGCPPKAQIIVAGVIDVLTNFIEHPEVVAERKRRLGAVDAGCFARACLALAEMDLRADLPGRPIQYGTTDAFLEFVGIKSLDELPASDVLSPRQIDAWLQTSNIPRAAGDADMGLDETEEQQMSLEQPQAAAPEGNPAQTS